MRQFSTVFLTLSFLTFTYFIFFTKKEMPTPTEGTYIYQGDEEGNASKREAWFEAMHWAAPGTNWRAIEHETAMKRHQRRSNVTKNRTANICDEEWVADNSLRGTWKERGSRNQAGSVFDTQYDFNYDKIYTISAGGTLFKGNREGNWEVINQDLHFTPNYFKLFHLDDGVRMTAAVNYIPHYSDDYGLTWQLSEGLNGVPGNANYEKAAFFDDGRIYLIFKPDDGLSLKVCKSEDGGMTFDVIGSFGTTNMDKASIIRPHNSDEVFALYKVSNSKTRFYKIENDALVQLYENTDFNMGSAPCNLVGTLLENSSPEEPAYRFYAFSKVGNTNYCNYTEDLGATWQQQGIMDFDIWSVGMFNSPTNQDFLISGGLECWRSEDGGLNWTMLNTWAQYYSNVENKLHADMMSFNEFQTFFGEKFQLISNHGGLSISYDYLQTTENIGLSDLNVSQYYCVRSHPDDPSYIFAGSQDQGFQIGQVTGDEVPDFEQVISGDYGQIVFSDQNSDVWTVYPDGDVSWYNNALSQSNPTAWFNIDSNHESVWLPPMMADPDITSQSVYVGGGNADGGSGSYIIKLTGSSLTGLDAENLDFNFRNGTGGTVTAMAHSKINTDRWYAATNNGVFFTSEDRGQNWSSSSSGLPQSFYLYGQAIWPGKVDENVVYFAGSGYSNPGVMVSYNAGDNFVPLDNGLPSTLVYDLTANNDESMLFAATESGPYVYITEYDEWFDMSGQCAPVQTYWSVEYIESLELVRFGTYGRGVWDFEIEELLTGIESTKPITDIALEVFPNPTSDYVNIRLSKNQTVAVQLELWNNLGQLITREELGKTPDATLENQFDLSDLPNGIYVLKVHHGETVSIRKIVKRY